MEYRTIRDILTNAEKCFGNEDAIRYKTGKNEIAAKTYTQLKEDSERITALLKKLGEPKSHIALIGATSYLWIACKKEFSRTTSSKLRGKDCRWRTVGSRKQCNARILQDAGRNKNRTERWMALHRGSWICR